MPTAVPIRVGRYVLHGILGSGGMATVHFGRLDGPVGFARTVAVKRLHSHFASDRRLASRFLDEARLVTRIHHSNVVQTLDVVVDGDECLLVMELVSGETLARLLQGACRRDELLPPRIVSAITCGILHGLHAAHEARDERGDPLLIVHRDVSPQNIIVGVDGIAKILDFGIAKAVGQTALTAEGELRGKTSYMAPEQLTGEPITARTDVFAAAIVLWESLVGRRLFLDETVGQTLANTLAMPIERPTAFVPSLPSGIDAVVLRGLERDPAARFGSAREMALALEAAVPPASPTEVAAWVNEHARDLLEARARELRAIETWREEAPTETHVATSRTLPTATAERPARPKRRAVVVVVAMALLLLLVGSIALVLRRHDVPVVAAPPPSAAIDPPTTASASVEALSEPPVAAPAVSAAAAGEPRSAPRERRTRAAPRVPSTNARCSPPFVYDASGHKMFKPECF